MADTTSAGGGAKALGKHDMTTGDGLTRPVGHTPAAVGRTLWSRGLPVRSVRRWEASQLDYTVAF